MEEETREKTLKKEEISIKEYYEYTARQIDREDGLIHKRITWFLTFEGFLFAALSFFVKKDVADIVMFKTIYLILPVLGFLIAIFAYLGVRGALLAIKDLKDGWNKKTRIIGEEIYPRPFGRKGPHFFSSSYCSLLPLSVAAAWVLIFFTIFPKVWNL